MTEPISAINVGSFNNKHVLVFLKGGMTCEGKVVLWCDGRSVLMDESSGSLLYIYNTKDNVVLVKVLAEKKMEIEMNGPIPMNVGPTVEAIDYKANRAPAAVKPFTEPSPPELDRHEPDLGLRLKKLADLKSLRSQAIKDMYKKRLKTFTPTQMMPAYYDAPYFTK